VLMGLLLPALEKAREQANTVRCANNLSQIGVALMIYAQENHSSFPRTNYSSGAPITQGTGFASNDPFAPGGPQANDVSADEFLLIRTLKLSTTIFADPYTDEIDYSPDRADPALHSNFTNWQINMAYSFADPYPDPAVGGGYNLNVKLNPAFVLAADRNPGSGPGNNSRNHEGAGQNVLYADSHVEWQTSPKCGVNGDDIYSNQKGQAAGSPQSINDDVLLPVN